MTAFTHDEAPAKTIDPAPHGLAMTAVEVEEGCALAARHHIASVCILPRCMFR